MAEVDRPLESLTRGPRHHFFGYYDKLPWDSTGRHVLALENAIMDRPPSADDAAVVGMVDLALKREGAVAGVDARERVES